MEDNSCVVSCILITHNQGSQFKKALFSLTNQNFSEPYEIIVINDASDEKNNSYVRDVLEEYPDVKYKETFNRSALLSRMDGVKLAVGDYITFLDGDDFYHEDYLKEMYGAIKKYDADVANCAVYYVREKGRISPSNIKTSRVYEGSNKAIKALFDDYYVHGFMHTKMYQADLLKFLDIRPFDELQVYEDIVLNYFVLKKVKRLVTIPKCLMYYNKTEGNSLTNSNIRIESNLRSCEIIKKDLIKSQNEEALKLFKKTYLRKLGLLYVDFTKTKFSDRNEKKEQKRDAKRRLKAIYKS